MTSQDTKRPEHQSIYLQVKENILFGEFVPGQPVTIHGLSETLNAGVTPIREAIRRLSAEGALDALANRRVAVPDMTPDRLSQIHLVRQAVEPELAELAAEKMDAATIQALVTIDAGIDQCIANGDVRGYLEGNYRFHFKLYEAADADVLYRIADSLWLQLGPSLRVVCGRIGTVNVVDNHQAAIDGLRRGDAKDVRAAMEADIAQGLDFIKGTVPS